MFGSQALETVIGLVAMFFVLALTAGTIVEIGSQLISARGKQLFKHIERLAGPDGFNTLKDTSVFAPVIRSVGWWDKKRSPSYLSAKSFVDAVAEAYIQYGVLDLSTLSDSIPLQKRLKVLAREANGDLLKIKAGLETWYDDQMDRLAGKYKRATSTLLLLLGVGLAVLTNGSAVHVAERLWNDPTTREAVVAAAGDQQTIGASGATTAPDLQAVADNANKLVELSLPVGWPDGFMNELDDDGSATRAALVPHLVGWAITGIMVMMGAPFWFDLLTRLVALRRTGNKPDKAVDDPASATMMTKDGVYAGPSIEMVPSTRDALVALAARDPESRLLQILTTSDDGPLVSSANEELARIVKAQQDGQQDD